MEMIIKLKWYWAHWLFGKNNRQPFGQPALRSGRPREHTRNLGIKTNDDMEGRPRKFL